MHIKLIISDCSGSAVVGHWRHLCILTDEPLSYDHSVTKTTSIMRPLLTDVPAIADPRHQPAEDDTFQVVSLPPLRKVCHARTCTYKHEYRCTRTNSYFGNPPLISVDSSLFLVSCGNVNLCYLASRLQRFYSVLKGLLEIDKICGCVIILSYF